MKSFIFCLLLFLFWLLFINSCFSQNSSDTSYHRLIKFPLLMINHTNYSNTSFSMDSKNGKIDESETFASIQVAIPLKKKKTYLFNNMAYQLSKYNIRTESGGSEHSNFHTIKFNIGFIFVLPSKWTIAINGIPNCSSDFKTSLNSDDFRYYVSAFARKRANTNCAYGFGLAYASYVAYFEHALIVPLFSITYKQNRYTTRMVLPSFIHQSFELNPKTELGINLGVNSNMFNMTYPNNTTGFDLNSLNETKFYIEPTFQRKLFGDIYLNFSLGYNVKRTIQIQDNEFKNEADLDINNKYYYRIGVVLLK